MLHFCRIYAYWPDKQGKSAWEKLDAHGPHALCHDEARDLHRFGSYVTGHLPRTHPLVENETLDDRALEGVWLGIDLSTPMFWMYSFKCEQWYVSVIPVISTTFCLSYVRRISLTALSQCKRCGGRADVRSLLMTSAQCTRRMSTRCNACRSVRARAFALQLRGSQFLINQSTFYCSYRNKI